MKIRSDFVTNSSSSSFIIARKPELTEKQKEAIISVIEKHFFGNVELTPESTQEEIDNWIKDNIWYGEEEKTKEINSALQEGKSIYSGWINFECPRYDIADMHIMIWEALEKADDSFTGIETSLDY